MTRLLYISVTTFFALFIACFQAQAASQPAFHVSRVNEIDFLGRIIGFSVGNVELVSPDGTVKNVTATRTSETVIDPSTVVQVWSTPDHAVEIDSRLYQLNADDQRMEATVKAGSGWTVRSIELGAPWVFAPSTPTRKTFSAFKEGQVVDWPNDGWYQQNSSYWPQSGYSPIAVFFDQATSEGVGFVSFDGGLKGREVYWFTGPGEVHAFVRWFANIAPSQSATTVLGMHHGYNMPTDHFAYYRNTYLKPFMDGLGIQEGSFPIYGALGASFWPFNNDVKQAAQWSLNRGAVGHIQYPPTSGPYFEPDPESYAWFSTLKSASQIPGINPLGVLIDPYFKSYSIPSAGPGDPWVPSGTGFISLNDPNNQAFIARLRNDLVAQGVTYAFWDQGNGVPPGEEMAWFNILRDWKRAGISIAAESSNDLASYVTGTNLIDGLADSDYHMLHTIAPLSRSVVVDHRRAKDTDGTWWWDRAVKLGLIPILDDVCLGYYSDEYFPEDLNKDGIVDIADLTMLTSHWQQQTSIGDINHDGIVDIQDFSLLSHRWQKTWKDIKRW